jgi:hypothetical protein
MDSTSFLGMTVSRAMILAEMASFRHAYPDPGGYDRWLEIRKGFPRPGLAGESRRTGCFGSLGFR